MTPVELSQLPELATVADAGVLSDSELDAIVGGGAQAGKLQFGMKLYNTANRQGPFSRWGTAGPYRPTGPVSSLTRRGVLGPGH